MQSVSQIWSFSKSLLLKEDSSSPQEQLMKPQGTSIECRSSICARQFCLQPLWESSSDESFCLQLKVQRNQVEGKKIPKPVYLITNLAYQLKPHYSRNMYLRARLDTCADVNIMLASIYHLIFKDPEISRKPALRSLCWLLLISISYFSWKLMQAS